MPYADYRAELSERSRAILKEQYERAIAIGEMVVFVRDNEKEQLVSYSVRCERNAPLAIDLFLSNAIGADGRHRDTDRASCSVLSRVDRVSSTRARLCAVVACRAEADARSTPVITGARASVVRASTPSSEPRWQFASRRTRLARRSPFSKLRARFPSRAPLSPASFPRLRSLRLGVKWVPTRARLASGEPAAPMQVRTEPSRCRRSAPSHQSRGLSSRPPPGGPQPGIRLGDEILLVHTLSRNSSSGCSSSRAPMPYSTAATCLHIDAQSGTAARERDLLRRRETARLLPRRCAPSRSSTAVLAAARPASRWRPRSPVQIARQRASGHDRDVHPTS